MSRRIDANRGSRFATGGNAGNKPQGRGQRAPGFMANLLKRKTARPGRGFNNGAGPAGRRPRWW